MENGVWTGQEPAFDHPFKVIEPLFEALPDHTIMYKLTKQLGFSDQLFKNIQVKGEKPLIGDITREFNRGMWTIGYTGHSPERLKRHQQNWHTFDFTTLEAKGGPAAGEYYDLPRPCWGTPELGHPGTPNLYDTSRSVAKGELNFRARFGVERKEVSLLADGSYLVGNEIQDGHPEFTADLLKILGWWDNLTAEEKELEDGSFGQDPTGRYQAQLRAVRQRQGPELGLDLSRPGADTSRAPIHQPPRSGGEISHLRRPQVLLPLVDPLRIHPGQGLLEGLPADHDQRAPGGIRGRRR